MSIKVFVIDDHEMMCDGLCSLMKDVPDIEILGKATSGQEGVKMVLELIPDIVILDLNMSDLNGFQAAEIIKRQSPSVRILVLSMYTDRKFVINALRAGAMGYILKRYSFEHLVEAIRTVISGQRYLCPEIINTMVDNYIGKDATELDSEFLTKREREVLELIAQGKTIKEISLMLCVSPKTVDSHLRHLMAKLNIHGIAALTKYAVRKGLSFL